MLEAHLERRHQMFRTIVLAVDGSKYSEKAVELAKRLATATSDEVVVAHVTELLPAPSRPTPAWTMRPTGRSSSSPRDMWPSWRRPGSRRAPSFAAP
jgi:nucleotide-binding universal stress UspA family protein